MKVSMIIILVIMIMMPARAETLAETYRRVHRESVVQPQPYYGRTPRTAPGIPPMNYVPGNSSNRVDQRWQYDYDDGLPSFGIEESSDSDWEW